MEPRGRAIPGWVAAIAAAQFALLVATSTRYGFHRDELYFIVAGGHPAFGYPDQPPLVPLLSWAMHALAPGSLTLVRLPSALAAAATTVLSALVAREAGGSWRAQIVAAGCTASSGFALAVGHFVTTTTFDLLSTTALLWLLIRAVRRGSGPSLLAAGVVVGLGAEAKPQVALVAVVALAALIALGPREVLWSPWAAAGVIVAIALAAPYVVWQQLHGWPQLTVAQRVAGSAEGGRIGFIPFQLVMVSPILIPVWVAGLVAPFRGTGLRALRFVSVTYMAVGLAYLIGDGKAYYLASLYPVLLGIGAVRIADRVRTWALAVAIGFSAVASAFIALPLLPEHSLQGSLPMAINPDLGEQVGWPRFVETVTSALNSIPPAERAHTAIFTSNYGEAGAIDVLGGALPRAYSGHNGFGEWGMPPASDTHALVLGYGNGPDLARWFPGCRAVARIDDGVGLDNDEQGGTVLYCGVAAPWPALWPKLRHLN